MRLNVVEEVLRACRADPVLRRGDVVVVAVSGGPDSTALLHAMSRARRRLGVELVAAHLDHGLRPESEADARHVGALCAELGVDLVPGRARLERASEDGARTARYSFLERTATEFGAGTIALGHTADDQVETVLLHLVRGSGLEGIAAMSTREGLRFRPMLRLWRADVLAYCARHHLEPATDASNQDPRYLRNRVRAELVPLLEALQPGARRAILRLADAARSEHKAVGIAAAAWIGGAGGLTRAGFRTLPEAVQVEVLRRLWAAATSGQAPGSSARLAQARRLVTRPGPGGMMQLGGGLELAVEGNTFAIRRRGRPPL